MQVNSSRTQEKTQGLSEKTLKPWEEHRVYTQKLGDIYIDIDKKKAARLHECGTCITFAPKAGGEEGWALKRANFCRVRLCPMCTWRRSLKVFGQVARIMHYNRRKYRYILLTLTVRNVFGDELDKAITEMMEAWGRFRHYKRFMDSTVGFFRSMEITRNDKKRSPWYGSYHPHFHVIVAVDKDYFRGDKYIDSDEWGSLWKKAMRVGYDPSVKVQAVRGDELSAVAEIAKYSVKSEEFLCKDRDLSVQIVALLDTVLHKRRFVAMGGVFKETHRILNLDDPETGDLTDAEKVEDCDAMELTYLWQIGFNHYKRV